MVSDNGYEIAKLGDEHLRKITDLETSLRQATGRNIALIAYAQANDDTFSQMSFGGNEGATLGTDNCRAGIED